MQNNNVSADTANCLKSDSKFLPPRYEQHDDIIPPISKDDLKNELTDNRRLWFTN
jgi:hypothetical protein